MVDHNITSDRVGERRRAQLSTRSRLRSALAVPAAALALAVMCLGHATANATNFSSGSSACNSKEDPVDMLFVGLHVSRNGGNTLGVNAGTDIASKHWHGGHGSSDSFYQFAKRGCEAATDSVTQSVGGVTYGFHARFWQSASNEFVGAAHHDQPCTYLPLSDSANSFNVARDDLVDFFWNFRGLGGNRGFDISYSYDRAPTNWTKCSGRYHVGDDGVTAHIKQLPNVIDIS